MARLNPVFSQTPAIVKIVLFISMVFVSFVACMVLGFFIAMPIFGVNMIEIYKAISESANPEYMPIVKYFQAVSQLGLFIVPPVIFALLVSKKPGTYLGLSSRTRVISILLTILIMVAAIPFINFLVEINAGMQLPGFMAGLEKWMKESEEAAAKITEAFLNVSTFKGLLGNIVVVALLASIGEEFFFRGILQRLFQDWTKNIHVAVLLSAIVFGAFHLQFYGFIPRTLMGVLFGYMFYWSGSLWLPIAAHFANNAIAVITDFLSRKYQLQFDIDKIGTENNAVLLVSVSILLVSSLLFLFYRTEKQLPGKNTSIKEQ
jgi:membrane protease YdiL (CAAX protease family)